MDNTLYTTDPFAGIRLDIRKVYTKKKLHHYEARIVLDTTRLMWRPGMEAAADLVGRGKSRELAIHNHTILVLKMAEKAGLMASTKSMSFLVQDCAANVTATPTFVLNSAHCAASSSTISFNFEIETSP